MYQLDLFFRPPGPKDWKNPVATKNVTSYQEWPKPNSRHPTSVGNPACLFSPNFGEQDLKDFQFPLSFSRSSHFIIIMGGYSEQTALDM